MIDNIDPEMFESREMKELVTIKSSVDAIANKIDLKHLVYSKNIQHIRDYDMGFMVASKGNSGASVLKNLGEILRSKLLNDKGIDNPSKILINNYCDILDNALKGIDLLDKRNESREAMLASIAGYITRNYL